MTRKKQWVCACLLATGAAFGAEPAATAEVTVDVNTELGPVKIMHAVGGGPTVKKPGGDQKRFSCNRCRLP